MTIDTIIAEVLATFTKRLWVGKNNAFYGRIFRSEENDGYAAKIYPLYYSSTVGVEGIEVLKDDTKDAMCFFDVNPNARQSGAANNSKVWVMFMVNLEKLYPTLSRNEATEKAKSDVIRILSCRFDEVTDIVSGYPAFNEYKWTEAGRADLSPHYLFRVELNHFLNVNC